MTKKLSPEQKREIIHLAKDPTLSYNDIAKAYNVHRSRIGQIAKGAGIGRIPGNIKNVKKKAILPTQPEKIAKTEVKLDISLLEALEEAYQDLEEEIKKWAKIKNDACRRLDFARRQQKEHFVAIKAIKRANDATE